MEGRNALVLGPIREEILVRLIDQLREAGIFDISLLVDKFEKPIELLAYKYELDLVPSGDLESGNRLESLYSVRGKIDRTFIIRGYGYIEENPFQVDYRKSTIIGGSLGRGPRLGSNSLDRASSDSACPGTEGFKAFYYFKGQEASLLRDLISEYYLDPSKADYGLEDIIYENLASFDMDLLASLDNLKEDGSYGQLESGLVISGVLDKLGRIFKLPREEIVDIRPLGRGMTNKSLIFSIAGEKYICRLPGQGTDELVNRQGEYACYRAVEKLGIADQLVYFNRDTGFKVSKYIEGSRSLRRSCLEDSKRGVDLLKKLHKARLKVEGDFDLGEKIGEYLGLLPVVPDEARNRYDQVLDLLKELASLEEDRVLVHIDPNADNFLVDPSGRLVLIDWEYAAMGDPLMDLPMIGVYSGLNHGEYLELLAYYLGRKPREEELLKLYIYTGLLAYVWALWCEYKELLGMDNRTYKDNMYTSFSLYYKKVEVLLRGGIRA